MQSLRVIDPKTGEERIVSVEEQLAMLEAGILFDVPPLGENPGSDDRRSDL